MRRLSLQLDAITARAAVTSDRTASGTFLESLSCSARAVRQPASTMAWERRWSGGGKERRGREEGETIVDDQTGEMEQL